MRIVKLMVVIVFFCGVAFSEEAPTLNTVLRAVPSPGHVTVDGNLENWDLSGAIVMADNTTAPHKLVRAAAMYDADGFYLALQFKDRTPMENHINPAASRGRAWCGDCVQLRINTGPCPSEAPPKPLQIIHVDAYWYTEGSRASAYVVYGELSPGGRVYRTVEEAEGNGVASAYRRDADGQGYVQELKLDWKLLRPDSGKPCKAGESIHMSLEPMWGSTQYNDHPAARITDLINPRRPERDMIWANPEAFGTVEFMSHGNLEPSPTGQLWQNLVQAFAALKEETPAAVPETAATVDRPCLEEKNDVEKKLNAWYAGKTAAGNQGDYYDNRDREHSAIDRKAFPQVKSFEYTPEQKRDSQDYGLFTGVRNCVSFGNSSTASSPDRGGCNPRYAILGPAGLVSLYAQYRGNNLYVYPAHHDYHPGRNGHGFWGDVVPVNTPYTLLSRGSSGNDIPFLNAAIHTSAAFSPEVKKRLVHNGLLMPTIQCLMRRTYKAGKEPDDYFTGRVHPAVFEGSMLDEAQMIELAHDMTVDSIPPLAQVRIEESEPLLPGINAPAAARSERLCDSPCAVGFVFRRWSRVMKLDASASTSTDIRGRQLRFRWALLQGIPDKVKIEPYDDGRRAHLEIVWHDRFPVQPGSSIEGNRVDIGVFAGNGQAWSTPAIISVICPDNELRSYDERGRLVDVQYAAMDTKIGYETSCVMPAEGVAPYDIRDWREFIRLITAGDSSLCGKLSAATLGADARKALAETSAVLAELMEKIEAEKKASPPSRDLNERWRVERQNAEKLSEILVSPVPAPGASVKERLEGMLNSWQENPAWYLDNRTVIDEALARASEEIRRRIIGVRDNLVTLGIYSVRGNSWVLQARRQGPGTETDRLTRAELLELKKFHLLLETQLVLPGVLVREPQFNYTDYRILQAQPEWLTMDYTGDEIKPSAVKVRAVSSPPGHKSLDTP